MTYYLYLKIYTECCYYYNFIKAWSEEKDMILSPSKSGILFINSFYLKNTLDLHPDIKNVDNYKYHGIWFDKGMNLEKHLKEIRKKCNFISIRLFGTLYTCSAKLRINLYNLFIAPLIDGTAAFFCFCKESTREKIYLTQRYCFRKFLLIRKNTEKKFIDNFLTYSLNNRALDWWNKQSNIIKERMNFIISKP